MNKRLPLMLMTVFALTGCAKTKLLYDDNAYNFADFDKNYYTEWEGIDELNISQEYYGSYSNLYYSAYTKEDEKKVKIGGEEKDFTWNGEKETQFGYNNNLSDIEKKFSYGVTSKLFDGRVRCESLYQKSRVQLDKSGFAMYFPKQLISTKYLGFACRGGTDYPTGQEFSHEDLNVNFEWSFYIHLNTSEYNKITYKLNNVKVPVDNGGNTTFVNFTPFLDDTFTDLYGAVAMSFKWKVNDDEKMATRPELTDDYTEKEKHHLALMLYEVFIGDSVWN